jgi:hypothetical protein
VKYVKALGATNREAIENFYNRMPDDTRKRVFSQEELLGALFSDRVRGSCLVFKTGSLGNNSKQGR